MGNDMWKTAVIPILLILGLLSGCSFQSDRQPANNGLQRYALLEVYAPDGTLLQSIEDEETIRKYIQYSSRNITTESMEAMGELEAALAGHALFCTIVSYKTPAAKYTDGTLERIMEISIYEDTNIVKEETDPSVIKNGAVLKSALTDYYELSDEGMDFYRSLADSRS